MCWSSFLAWIELTASQIAALERAQAAGEDAERKLVGIRQL